MREQAYAAILGAIPEGIALFAPDGSTTFTNAAADTLLGGTPTNAGLLPIATLREALTRSDPPPVIEVETGAPPRVLQAEIVPVGEEGSLLVVLRDVSEAHRADRVRTDFVANASHELKTPVASIQAIAETIRSASKDDPGAVERFTERLESESLRMSRIVADLLDLSRLEASRSEMSVVNLAGIADDEAARIRPTADAAGLELSTRGVESTALVRGDERDLRLLVRNLLDNAVRYTAPGGSILMEMHRDEGSVQVSVTDTGAGIPQRDIPRVFERFYRVDRARARETGGTGLGLAIVRHIAESHGGSIEVTSELGVGTTFTVSLPATGLIDQAPTPP